MIKTLNHPYPDITLRQAALVVGFAYLLNPAPYAEYVYAKLVDTSNIDQTIQHISRQSNQFVAAIFSYLFSLTGDVVLAWGMYALLSPVHWALARLMAWFQLVYAAVGFTGVLHLVVVFNLLHTPTYRAAFLGSQLQAQVFVLLSSFRSDWTISLILFGIHLLLAGYLIYHSGYIPRFIGVLLVINGLGYVVNGVGSYLLPRVSLKYLPISFFGELVFMVWLLIRGWKLTEPGRRVIT